MRDRATPSDGRPSSATPPADLTGAAAGDRRTTCSPAGARAAGREPAVAADPTPLGAPTASPSGEVDRSDDGRLQVTPAAPSPATAELEAIDLRGDRVHLRSAPAGRRRAGQPPAAPRHRRPGPGDAAGHRPRRAARGAGRRRRPAGRLLRRDPAGRRHRDGLGADPAPGQRPGRPQPRRAPARAARRRRRARDRPPAARFRWNPDGLLALRSSTRTSSVVKITFLVLSAHKLGGTERSAITQANALAAAGHDVRILSVVRAAEEPAYAIDERVTVEHLVDLTGDRTTRRCTQRESVLVPRRWDKQFSALTDVALERGLRRPRHRRAGHRDPGAAGLRGPARARPRWWSSTRSTGRPRSGPRAWSRCWSTRPRADVVALLTPTIARLAARRARPGRARDRGRCRTRCPRASRRARCSTRGRSWPPAGW